MMKPMKWTDENIRYMEENYPHGTPTKIMAKHLGCSEDTVRNYAAKRKLHRPVFWTPEKDALMKEKYPNTLNVELAKMFGTTESAVSARGFKLGLKKTREFMDIYTSAARFPKGHVPMNKGKKIREWASEDAIRRMSATMFKKGLVPSNHKEIGHERVTTDGFVMIKVAEPDVFVLKHRMIWERHNGPIPEGMIVTFKDGNTRNFDISNLQLMSREDNMKRNSFRRYPIEIQKTIRTIGVLNRRINSIEKGKKW